MKKVRRIIFLLFLIFINAGIVSADNDHEWLTLDWFVSEGNIYYDPNTPDYTSMKEIDDGYLITTIDEDGYGVIRRYSDSGRLIYNNDDFDGFFMGSLVIKDNYAYTMYYSYDSEEIGIIYFTLDYKDGGYIHLTDWENGLYPRGCELYYYNDNLYAFIASYDIDSDTDYGYGMKYAYIVDSEEKDVIEKKDYSDLSKNEIDLISYGYNDLINSQLNRVYEEDGKTTVISQQLINGDYKYFVGYLYDDQEQTYSGLIVKKDLDNNTIWAKKNLNIRDNWYWDIIRINDTHVAITSHSMSDNGEFIYVLDEDGNIVETHNINDTLNVDGSYMIDFRDFNKACLAQARTYNYGDDYYQLHLLKYIINYQIATEIQGGSGKIEVVSTSQAGNEVTFKVSPDKGYELVSVKVIDSKGNVYSFTDNTFTMPSTDVTIIAELTVRNPNTKDRFLFFGIVLIFISYFGYIMYKKYKWLKN